MHWLAYSAGVISDGIDDLGLTLNLRLGTSDDSAGVDVRDRLWEGGCGRGYGEAPLEAGAGEFVGARLWEREGLVDGGGGNEVERSVREGAGCGTCSVGSVVAGSVAPVEVSMTGERGSAAEWPMVWVDSSLSTGVVALLDTTDGTDDRTECSDKVDSEDSKVSRFRSGSASCCCVCGGSTAGGLRSAN